MARMDVGGMHVHVWHVHVYVWHVHVYVWHVHVWQMDLRTHLPEMHAEVTSAPSSPYTEYGGCFGKLIDDGVVCYFGGKA